MIRRRPAARRQAGRHRLDQAPPDARRPVVGGPALATPRGSGSGRLGASEGRYIGTRRAPRRTPARDPLPVTAGPPPLREVRQGTARGRFGPPPMPRRQSPSDIPDRTGQHYTRAAYDREQRYRREAARDRRNREFVEITDRELGRQRRDRALAAGYGAHDPGGFMPMGQPGAPRVPRPRPGRPQPQRSVRAAPPPPPPRKPQPLPSEQTRRERAYRQQRRQGIQGNTIYGFPTRNDPAAAAGRQLRSQYRESLARDPYVPTQPNTRRPSQWRY